jgi:uncharacterized protein YndB with AHSA1/START domain
MLTEERHLEAWFPTTIEGDLAPGGALRFKFRQVAMPAMAGEMLAFDPPTLMELNWGGDILRFEITSDGDGSILELRVTFAELGKVSRDAAGWHVCLEQLSYADADTEVPWSHADRWRVVHPGYVERFGPEASTEGPPEEWEQAYPEADPDSEVTP